MTDNEKRAHDLAIFALSKTIDFEQLAKNAAQCGETEISVDFYAEYIKAYNAVLPAFNRDFPET